MSADRSADGVTAHIHPDGSAERISRGDYVGAVMTQLCERETCDATDERD